MKINQQIGIHGFYTLQVLDTEGNMLYETGKKKNLFLDNGIAALNSFQNIVGTICVGTGNSDPEITQTKLDNWLANTSTRFDILAVRPASPDFNQTSYDVTFEFSQGSVIGNIAELGLAASTANNPDLITRALIKDEFDNPTTVTVTADNILRIKYQLIINFPTEDITTSSMEINDVTTEVKTLWFQRIKFSIGTLNNNLNFGAIHSGDDISDPVIKENLMAYTGQNLAGISTIVNGTSIGTGSNSIDDNNTRMRYTGSFTTAQGNSVSGITHLAFFNSFQVPQRPYFIMQFNPPIPKTDQDTFNIAFETSFTRDV